MKKVIKTIGFIFVYLAVYLFFQIFYIALASIIIGIAESIKNPEVAKTKEFAEIIQEKIINHVPISIIFASIVSIIIYSTFAH